MSRKLAKEAVSVASVERVQKHRTARKPKAAEPVALLETPAPTHEEITKLAYSYWLERGCLGGCADQDWQRAEEALRVRA